MAESSTKNLTVCWTTQLADPPDAYDITSHSLDNPGGKSTLIRHGSPEALWENTAVCISLGAFTPGQTYNIGVVALKGNDRSQKTSILHTASMIINTTFKHCEHKVFLSKHFLCRRSNGCSGGNPSNSGYNNSATLHPASTARSDRWS